MMYALPEEDNPQVMLNAKQALDNMEGDLGIICVDFNTTLDAKHNRFGYTSDSHKKCRCTITKWLETGELMDAVRCFYPETLHYSWRTNIFKKGRIDHMLVTPKLMPFVSEAIYLFHEHKISDHSSLLFTLDIEKSEKGPGILRANPSLLNHPNYKTLINNVIRFIVLDAIKDK